MIGVGPPREVLTEEVLERTYGARLEVLQHGGMTGGRRRLRGAPRRRTAPTRAPGGAMTELLDPYNFEFFRNGLVVATIAGALCGLIGVYVVLKGMSDIGHGLSHAIFGGFAASALLGVNFLLGAGAWGVASALMIGGGTRRRVIKSDAAMGVITTASFALGLALFALFGRRGANFDAALFGSILGVSAEDVIVIACVTAAAVAFVFFGYRRLLFTTFDPEVADATGVRTARMDACSWSSWRRPSS
ncbi:MAG TPA: metal ABC transporter permease [Miltoncostaeaceae bacterium]|nr:metal ABC transporter permease [Miltoncostaeaceae bacterium]